MEVLAQGQSKPRVQTVQRCSSPSEDIKKKWSALAASACQFTPLKRDGTRYTYGSTCEKNGIALQTKSVITVISDSSYRVDTETHTNAVVQKELLTARRIGDCAK